MAMLRPEGILRPSTHRRIFTGGMATIRCARRTCNFCGHPGRKWCTLCCADSKKEGPLGTLSVIDLCSTSVCRHPRRGTLHHRQTLHRGQILQIPHCGRIHRIRCCG